MSDGALNYKLGGDSSELQAAFEKGLRYAGDFTNNLKRAFSVRGIFDGIVEGAKDALGGGTIGDIFLRAMKGAMGKEQLQQNFAGLLKGDERQASATLDALKRMADDNVASGTELQDAARTLIGAGGANGGRAVQSLKMLGEVSRGLKKPIGELAEVWAKVFRDGVADQRSMMELQRAGVPIVQALAASMGVSAAVVEAMGRDGKITFAQLDTAMQRLTQQGGQFFGQIDRYNATLGALVDDTRDTFGKIPGAFFAGILGDNMEGAKNNVRAIREMIAGWVDGAKLFGSYFAAAVREGSEMIQKDGLIATLGTGLKAALIGAINVLMAGLAAAAEGFGRAIEQIFNEAGDRMNPFGDHKPGAGGRIGAAFTAGLKDGWGKDAPQLDNPAGDQFAAGVNRKLAAARGADVMQSVIAALGGMVGAAPSSVLGAPNRPGVRGGGDSQFTALDSLSKIGLFVGAGGPQGERHAQDIAKHTGKMTGQLEKVISHMETPKHMTAFF